MKILRIRSFRRAAAAVVVATAFFASGVLAYETLKPERTWRNTPTYIVDDRGMASITDNDGGVAATVNAIKSEDAWNGAGAGEVVKARPGNVSGWQLGDGKPMLNFDDPEGVCTGNCLAATFTGFFQRRRGQVTIVDADIVTNTAYEWTSMSEPGGCSNEFFIEGVQVHEVGHGLGLGHSNVAGSTMFPSVSACNNGPATIAQDDMDGLLQLYGSGGGGGGGGGGGCTLLPKGASCSQNNECCSGKCRGPNGNKSCK